MARTTLGWLVMWIFTAVIYFGCLIVVWSSQHLFGSTVVVLSDKSGMTFRKTLTVVSGMLATFTGYWVSLRFTQDADLLFG